MAVTSTTKKRGLAALVGTVAAAALFQFTPTQEGTIYTTYRDPVGVLSYCTGATEDAMWGKTYTPKECAAQLDKDLLRHAEGVMACIKVPLTDGQKVAFVDTAYNIGVHAFCNSSMAKKTNAGDKEGGCNSLFLWNKAGGKVLQGLVNRRNFAHQYCTGKMGI